MEVKSYRDLLVWQKAMDVAKAVYDMTASFPKEELYGLVSQIRRASVSIASHIAEGSSRRSTQEFIRYINIASALTAEVETPLTLSERLGFLKTDVTHDLRAKTQEISRMLYFLHRSLAEKNAA